jgi:hypothetical protein
MDLESPIFLAGTFKLKKRTLQAEGFDPSTVADPIFYLDSRAGKYIKLAPDVYQDIYNGKMRM